MKNVAETMKNLSFDNCCSKMCMNKWALNSTKWDFFSLFNLMCSVRFILLHLLLCSVWCVSFRYKIAHNSCIHVGIHGLFSRLFTCGSIYADFDCEQFVVHCSVCARIIALNVDSMLWYEYPFPSWERPSRPNYCHLQIKRPKWV